eukprot:symbB.v1.2.010485.t1/scaffold674.1/size176181/2
MTDPLLSTRSFPASLSPLPPFHRNLRNLPRVMCAASDGRDLAVRPHDARVVGRFGYRHLTAVERSASVVAALLLLGLLSVPRGPWHRAAFVVRNASKAHWIWVCLSVLWFSGSAYLSIFAFKILTVMLLAKPKLLEPHKILPSAFSVIRELPGNVAIHLLRKEACGKTTEAKETLPVICFHGFGANASSYEDSLELLSEKLNALVLCPDQVGFGLTRRPELCIDSQLLRNDICGDLLHPDRRGKVETYIPAELFGMGGGSGGRGNGHGNGQPQQPVADGGEAVVTGFQRGLDSGLAKAAPLATGLSQKTYKSYRRRLELFGRQCLRRGKETAVEGACLVMSQLQDVAWDAAESIDYDDIELDPDPFKPIKKVLDVLFQHEEEVELPERCQEFLSSSAETKEKNYKPIWSGIPRWTHPQVKALCGGDLNVQNVAKAMTRMFGGDSKPNSKDTVFRNSRDELHYIEQNEYFPEENETQEVYYYDEADEWPEDEMDEIDFVGCDDEEISAEIDEASIAVEDAYINYLDSRKKMRELALARGFYPVVALDMGGSAGSGGKGGQKGSSKSGGGKGKGKKSGKGHGKSFQPPRRYVYGARRGKGGQAGTPSHNDQTAPKSTASGSTGQHGPRFKRYRLPASGIKEVPDDVQMVTDMEQVPITQSIYEEINAMDTAVGWAIMDSGATRSVCGEAVWNQISDYLLMRGLADKIDVQGENRDFRFGDGVVVRSKVSARIPVCIAKQWKELTLHVLPGETPLLLARPDLERWKTVVDYGNKVVRVDGVAVKPAYTSNGHYMLNIFDDLQDVLNVEDFVAKKEDDEETTFVNSMITDDISDMEYDLEVTMDEGVVEESIYTAVHHSEEHNRVLKFWEAYVDEGRLGQSSGGWQNKKNPTISWWHPSVDCGPPCRTSITKTPERKEELANLRTLEEHNHLQFYKDIHYDGKHIGYDTTLEQPADGMSWKTETLESMRGYYETVLDRCRTGLKASPDDTLFVKKPTRFRSTSRKVVEAVNLRCLCGNLGHTQMFGRGAVLKKMQNYEIPLVRKLGEAIYEAMEELWKRRGQAELMMMEMVEKSTEEMKYLEQNKELIKIGGQDALRSVAMLHKQLGHPSGARLVAAIQERNLPDSYVKVARKYQCPTHPEAEPVNPHGLWESPEEAEQERIKEDIRREVEQSAELDPANSTGKLTDDQRKLLGELQAQHPDVVDPRSEIKTSEDTEMESMRTKEKRHYEEAVRFAAQLSERHNRKLDGLPPRMEDGQSAPKQARVDEIHYVELDSEEVMMAEDKPNARVILQGFKHRDVVQGKLDTESPTLSRLGKYLIVLVGCIKRWKFGTMDVKSAFLQSDYIHHKVELYGEPSADMRRLLSEMIGLKGHEVMMMTKPAFGDVRAPRQWNETADHALTNEVGLWKHRLDGCIYLSTRLATKEDAEFEDKQMFCGCQLTQAMDAGSVTFDLEKYLHQLKPLSIEKNRKANPGEKATPKEQSQLRGLLGGLAWPANQTQPHLAASVSLAQASSANATVGDMLEVNKVLRFAKETSKIAVKIRGHGSLKELRFGAYTDVSWSTRPDGTSQGGWLIFVATEEEMSGSKPFPLTVVDWASKKLTRICRSSLAAEAQTMATAVDQLEWTKDYVCFDVVAQPEAGQRGCDEVAWRVSDDHRCTSSIRRQHVDVPGSKACREKDGHRDSDLRVNEGIYTIADMEIEEKEECKMCLLRGCGLPVEEGRKYCSKRHYHAAQGQAAKVAKKAAEGAVWMLTFAGEGGEAEAFDGITYEFVLVYVMVFVGVFFAGFCMMIGYTTLVDELDGEMELPSEEHFMCEVSDPDEWRLVHHGTGESESSEDEDEEAEINLDGTPGRPMTSTRFSPAQLRLLVAKGYYVFSDEEVQVIRDGFARDYIRPSFCEVFTPEMMQRVLHDQSTPVPFPSDPEEWDGMSAETQRAMWSRLDDALLLGCHYEEVTTISTEEARLLRESLETVRQLEIEVTHSFQNVQTYTLSGNAVIAGAVLNAEHCIGNKIVILGHSMGAITAAALAVNKARSGCKVTLVLESPAFLSKPSSSLKSSKIGMAKGLLLRLQRRILRVVLQVPGFTYSRLFWQRGLAMATRELDKEGAERQVLRYRWPSLSENWALGLANFVTARLITMEDVDRDGVDFHPGPGLTLMVVDLASMVQFHQDALVLHELIEASLENHLRVLIITGDQDRVVPVARSKFLQKLLQCDLQIMEGCGHIAHEEDPVTFADHVARSFASGAMRVFFGLRVGGRSANGNGTNVRRWQGHLGWRARHPVHGEPAADRDELELRRGYRCASQCSVLRRDASSPALLGGSSILNSSIGRRADVLDLISLCPAHSHTTSMAPFVNGPRVDLPCHAGYGLNFESMEPMCIPVKQLSLTAMLDLNFIENEPARIDLRFIGLAKAQTPKKKVSKVKDLPAKSPQDADKMVRIFMPDVNKNAGPERGVSTKGMNFGGMTDRQPRPPKAT